ncbi:amidohydrolase family protein [Paenibacillus sp. NPDC057967]|uniref:amidohydrolase family protein n=1 Tax=Paenibacillus sp. NPDC057967 TaxID=3346293 RepID=UPI0036DCE36F
MSRTKRQAAWLLISIAVVVAAMIFGGRVMAPGGDEAAPVADQLPDLQQAAQSPEPSAEVPKEKSLEELVQAYRDLQLMDAHNHNAAGGKYLSMIPKWDASGVDRIVLFGAVSEPAAEATDETAWKAYQNHPERFIPFTSGINLLEQSGLDKLRENLEQGYFGLGEIAAASQHSPVLAQVEWKTEHPMDGILPDIYALCAEYQAPVLLHIDPLNGMPVTKLKEALAAYPDTTFILAHANAFNSPANIESWLEAYPNLYADFFAGFTVFNPESANVLEDFIPVIRKFQDRFVLSTDSGFGLNSEEQAIEAMYHLIDKLDDRELAERIAYSNMNGLIERQPATRTQLEQIRALGGEGDSGLDLATLSKREAGEWLIRTLLPAS